ncbi:alginate lyase family protein [Prosthecobacter sp.]|uniref:heparinase II/III family protein n=1 Tax=Prosthecobacter sp. TaxID=1965333 RepID=UPI002487DE73|nr:alginate lyase family protein [Prosthecobacter sp.]MDI1311040.1 alginate lyase family protein [Prosthecobacter sp.]
MQRLRAMSVGEITRRVAERLGRRNEIANLRRISRRTWDGTFTEVPKLPRRDQVPPELCRQLAADAERLMRGEWDLFGWKCVEVGAPPCWHRDATLGVVIDPDIPSRKLDHRHLQHDADARTIWEINRWSEMTRMAMHSALNDEVHAIRVSQLWLEDWCDRNPPGHGINWTSPLEAGLRLMNFCWFDALVRGCNDPELARRQDELTARIVPPHAWWIWQRRSFGSSANNHLIGELSALLMAISRWPALARMIHPTQHLVKLLEREILQQFAPDGGNKEQALHYHLFAWEMCWHAGTAVGGFKAEVSELLTKAAQYCVDVVETPECWDFGDSDDAQVLPLPLKRTNAAAEFRGWLLNRADGAALRFWLGEPPQGIKEATRSKWLTHEQSGLAIWRDARWTARADASPLGLGSMAAHGHLDALHVSLWFEQHALIIDPGTGAYYGNPELRARLASWEAHNGPVPVTGRSTPQRMGAFLWAKHHGKPDLEISDDICVMSLACEGRRRQRAVHATQDQVEICDDVGLATSHVVTWQLAPGWRVEQEHKNSFVCHHPESIPVHATLNGEAIEQWELVEREASPHFRERVTTQAVKIIFRGTLTTIWRKSG